MVIVIFSSFTFLAECLAERHQVPDLMSLVRPGRGFDPTTLCTRGEQFMYKFHTQNANSFFNIISFYEKNFTD